MPRARVRTVASVERFFQFSLLGLVASGFFALAGSHYLDRPTLALTFVALALRGLIVAGWLRLEIPPKLISAAALGYVLFYPFDFYVLSHDFLTATVHGVCFLAAIKILTAENNRDYLYTGIVAFIELIGAAILSFQAGFFAWLALYILFAMAAFTSAEIRRGLERSEQIVSPPGARLGWRLAIVAGTATAGILVITAGLFLIVPRTARAAAMLFPNAPHVTGFSNVVDLGAFGEISKDTHPVMHILSYSRALPQNLKWRGTAAQPLRWQTLVGTARRVRRCADCSRLNRGGKPGAALAARWAQDALPGGCDQLGHGDSVHRRNTGIYQCDGATAGAHHGGFVPCAARDRRGVKLRSVGALGSAFAGSGSAGFGP